MTAKDRVSLIPLRRLVLVLTLGLSVGVMWLGFYLIGPEVDNRLGIWTARDVRAVLGAPTDSFTVEEHLRRQLSQFKCEGWHHDQVWQTFVSCSGKDHRGQALSYYWEVDSNRSPKDGRREPGLHITALTRTTALFTPAYQPTHLALSDMPMDPSMTAGALYGLSSGR